MRENAHPKATNIDSDIEVCFCRLSETGHERLGSYTDVRIASVRLVLLVQGLI